jgi:hypothetical protein
MRKFFVFMTVDSMSRVVTVGGKCHVDRQLNHQLVQPKHTQSDIVHDRTPNHIHPKP